MNDIELGTLLADPTQAGAYFVDARDREALVEAGGTLQFAVLPVDLRACADADAAMCEIAEVLRFPDWFGENLDALADCLGDLSWLPSEGYVLVLENTADWRAQESDTFDTVLEILNQTAQRWAENRVPFWAFLPVSTLDLAAING
ncbi:MAG: barstar family protein [Xanthomonadales bacterium]|nr:barstar family protein [Xanthomonadales bacterium]